MTVYIYKPNGDAPIDTAILPSDVRFALRYRKGIFGQEEIKQLARPEFKGLPLYFTMKGLDGKVSAQTDFILEINDHFSRGNKYDALEGIIQKYLPHISQEGVIGQKAAQISRLGFSFVDEGFSDLAAQIYADKKQPVLLAYAALIGYNPFFDQMPDDSAIGIVKPADLANNTLGLQVKNEGTEPITKQSDFSGFELVLVDDTKSTGNTFECAKSFVKTLPKAPQISGQGYIVNAPK